MEEAVTILDVLAVDLCALQILDYVPLRDLMRSERVSRQCQETVHKYIRSTDLTLLDSSLDTLLITENTHRSIRISSLTLSKSVEKIRFSIVKVVTNNYSDLYFQIIASSCPGLQHIQFCNINGQTFPINQIRKFVKLNQLSIKYIHRISDCALGMLLQNINCKKLDISVNRRHHPISFSFLSFCEPSSLTSLSFSSSYFLISDLVSQFRYLQNITSLELEFGGRSVFKYIHLLLNRLPKLENLSLSRYGYTGLKKEMIDSFIRLQNLKRLVMRNNESVSDALLEAVAQGCKKLEYLDVNRSIKMEAHTIAAFCTIPSPLVIVFSFPYVYQLNCSSLEGFKKLVAEVKNVPFIRELEELGL